MYKGAGNIPRRTQSIILPLNLLPMELILQRHLYLSQLPTNELVRCFIIPLMALKIFCGKDVMCNISIDGGPEHDGVTELSSIVCIGHSAML